VVVDRVGGAIGVTCAAGAGATFWFALPLEAEGGPAAAGDEPASAERLGGLVVVIGGRDAAASLAERVAGFGAATRCVASAEAAAELLRHGHEKAALLVTARTPPVDLPALGALVTALGTVEPVDLVAVGAEPGPGPTPTLADLPGRVDDAGLRATLRMALRRPAGTLGATLPDMTLHRRSLRVLVAEDNRTNQKVVGKLLEQAGHRPTIVACAAEALEALEEPGGFDVVLMDINMPEMTGIEAVKLLRFTHPPERLPPIVALSADATPQTREECRSVGFSAYLTKPVDTKLLLRTLTELTGSEHDPLLAGEDGGDGGTAAVAAAEATLTPAEALGSARPALDRAKLANLAALDRGDGFLEGLIADFVVDVRGILDQLARAAARGDAREMRDQAHALRSSAAHLGAMRLFELLLGWRELDDHALLLRSSAELGRLAREVEEVEAALAAFQEEHKAAMP
jgi:two-component system sensor histidine kinase RpfC